MDEKKRTDVLASVREMVEWCRMARWIFNDPTLRESLLRLRQGCGEGSGYAVFIDDVLSPLAKAPEPPNRDGEGPWEQWARENPYPGPKADQWQELAKVHKEAQRHAQEALKLATHFPGAETAEQRAEREHLWSEALKGWRR